MTEGEAPGRDLRGALGEVTRRLEELAASVARLAPAAAPAGEPLDEGERRRLAPLESLLAIGPTLGLDPALLLVVDRAIHAAGADCAAVFVATPAGDLEATAHRGFNAAPPRMAGGEGIVGRAFREQEGIRAGPAHEAADPLLHAHGLRQAIALPAAPAGEAPLGVLFAGRRRAAPFAGDALEVLRHVADRAGLVLRLAAGGVGSGAAGLLLGEDLDPVATAARVAEALAAWLGASPLALLLRDGEDLRLAGGVGLAPDRGLPVPASEPLATAAATGRPWVAAAAPIADALGDFLGAPPRLILPLVAHGRTVAVAVAGGPAPLDPARVANLVAPAAFALRNAQLHAETLAALAAGPTSDPRGTAPVPPPARDLVGLLAVLVARIGLVRERLADPALAAELAVAEEAGWRAAEAVRGFLGFAPGARSDELRPLDLGAVIGRVVEGAAARRGEARDGAPDVACELEPLPPVRGNAAELTEALGHLLDNAVEASGTGAMVTVRARWDGGGHVEVAVEDSGGGMDEAVRERAMQPFFSTKGPGRLGLGLAVAQAIVHRHRGTLSLASALGKGTRVRLILPTAGRPADAPPPPLAPAPPRVLVIEDEAVVREALVGALVQRGHAVFAAGGAEEGVALVEREAVDVVITDLALGGRSGLDVARAVKRQRPGTPVILLTAWPGGLEPAVVRASGVDRVLEKPAGATQVLEAIDAVLAARGDTGP
jgi:signal transduction histidine kinase/CheY-like chemotaxis protein